MTTPHKPNYVVSDHGNVMTTTNKPNYRGQLRASDHAGASLDIEAVGRKTMAKAYCDAANMPIPTHVKALLKKDVDKMSRAKANQLVPGFCP
jgi:hypothetical protein